MMYRLLERVAPSDLMLWAAVGALTFCTGLHLTAVFLLGVVVHAAGKFLDTYGLKERA